MGLKNSAQEKFVYNAWYIAAWPSELEDQPLARTILDEKIVLFRDKSGKVAALEDRCCHRAAPLSFGKVMTTGIQCGYHGMVFDSAGICIDNPGAGTDSKQYTVRSFPIVEQQNFIWIWMGDNSKADENKIIEYPHHEMSDDWSFEFSHYHIAANYIFMMDNLMDLTHLAYVHTSTIGGNPEDHAAASMEVTTTETGVKYMRWMLNSQPPPTFVAAAGFKGKVDRWSNFEYVAPSSVLQRNGALDVGKGAVDNQEQEGGISIRLFHHVTPETATSCHYFWSSAARGVVRDSNAGKKFQDDIAAAFLEDKAMVEAQQSIVSAQPHRELLSRTHDKAVALERKALHKMLACE